MSETSPERGIVLPGELLGTAEEFVPGPGAYEDSGRVYAALLGRPVVDPAARAIAVHALHEIPRLTEGELVYVRVDEIKTAMAIGTVLASAETNRVVPGAPEGTVHISKAKEGYTDSLNTEFGIGDLLLARVLQGRPSVKLTTAPPALGVVSARCQSCHGQLVRASGGPGGSGGLECPRCGARERRKLATGYGALHAELGPGAHGRTA